MSLSPDDADLQPRLTEALTHCAHSSLCNTRHIYTLETCRLERDGRGFSNLSRPTPAKQKTKQNKKNTVVLKALV